MSRQAVILAGGFGTRLRSIYGDIPKPMVPLLGKPVLEHLVDSCLLQGFSNILVLAHHRHEVISSHFGSRIHVHVESEPKGTAGALMDALTKLDDRFLVLYGDTYVDVDLNTLWNTHDRQHADATLFVHPNSHPYDSDLVEMHPDRWVNAIHPYPHPAGSLIRNRVNAALYVMERELLDGFESDQAKPDIAKHLFPNALARGKRLFGYESVEYVKDMGTPERLGKVEADIRNGVTERLSSRSARQAIFLDRDGTLNVEKGLIREPAQIELYDGVADAVKKINQSGLVSVVITNQPIIARGEVTMPGLERIHARLETLLGEHGAYLDRIIACPHHPDSGFENEIPELKFACACRKPETGMVDTAVSDLCIDRTRSWMVGDTTIDMETARRAGLKSILLRTGYAGQDGKFDAEPDYVMADLATAVRFILTGHGELRAKLIPILESLDNRRLLMIGGLSRSGKSTLAQILREQFAQVGRNAHIICLDGWLKPVHERHEGLGVESRFDLDSASRFLRSVLESTIPVTVTLPYYDRKTRTVLPNRMSVTIRPDDILIVEGVLSFLSSELLSLNSMSIFVDVDHNERMIRLHQEYSWRGLKTKEIEQMIASRELDESMLIQRSAERAQFRILNGSSS